MPVLLPIMVVTAIIGYYWYSSYMIFFIIQSLVDWQFVERNVAK